jgi:hypothetical protein
MNHNGHDAVRIYGLEGHGGLVNRHAILIRYKIEPDLGFGADFRRIGAGLLP